MGRCPSRGSRTAALALLVTLATALPAGSQPVDCGRLRRQILMLGRGDAGRDDRYQRAARRQRAEIDRTTAYSRSLGCDRRRFLFFGDPPPPQCGRIEARLARMTANLQALQERVQQASAYGSADRDELTMRYNAYCRGGDQLAAAPQPGNFLERMFGGGEAVPPPAREGFQRMPLDPYADPARRDADPDEPTEGPMPAATEMLADDGGVTLGGPKAVCVKTCDGSFFPVSYAARRDTLDSLEALCHASCPNGETKLYTYSIYGEIGQAVDKEGVSYAELPNANRFAKKFDSSCGCRAPGRTWAETLVDAEKLYGGGRRDVVVTPQLSDALAQIKSTPVSKGRGRAKAVAATAVARASAPPPTEDATATDAKAAAQVPTASKDSAGIDVGDAGSGNVHGTKDGATHVVVGPDGRLKQIRVIAPDL